MLTSSNPSWPHTTRASVRPRSSNVSAIRRPIRGEYTPTTIARGRAGLISGPIMLKTVRTPICLRTGARIFIVGWNAWAKRKQKPAPLTMSAHALGGSEITPPRCSSTSALPHCEEADRLPCLATLRPAPAATIAEVVETLNVSWPSPPVPTMSTTSSTPQGSDLSSTALQTASTMVGVSPCSLMAMRNADSCASVALPSMTSSKASLSCAPVGSSRSHSMRIATCSAWRVSLWLYRRGASISSHVPAEYARKLRNMSWPCSLRILSGWNCTPSTTYFLCLTAITMPPWVFAVTSSASGTLLPSPAREW
eukprot:comp20925_c0_seq1/m.27930 comp20925_c0_seq1/g.27930  ORF comp20925_c0_seq1/g.27930 comp20925_c0_seq1/m.27930 type:complete len:309 (+) comp20925_c0_seq1:380-1306(+)